MHEQRFERWSMPWIIHAPNSVISTDVSQNDLHTEDSRSAQPTPNKDAATRLEHAKLKATMNRVPMAARARCATAFSDILIRIMNDPRNLESFAAIFAFRPTIVKPQMGGTKRNLRREAPRETYEGRHQEKLTKGSTNRNVRGEAPTES